MGETKKQRSPLTTLCYIEKDDSYLMLHRIKKKQDVNEGKWIGVGGHFEENESPENCLLREVKEETGLIIENPKLKGIYHWFCENIHNIGYLYKVDYCEGELRSSGEGEVYWISLEEYVQKELAGGMDKVLAILIGNDFSECYCKDGEEILR